MFSGLPETPVVVNVPLVAVVDAAAAEPCGVVGYRTPGERRGGRGARGGIGVGQATAVARGGVATEAAVGEGYGAVVQDAATVTDGAAVGEGDRW